MLTCTEVAPAIGVIPRHDLLVVARAGAAHTIADPSGRALQGGQVSRLAEAGPDLLVRGLSAAACLRGLDEERTRGGAGGELACAIHEELSGGGGDEKEEGGEEGRGRRGQLHHVGWAA